MSGKYEKYIVRKPDITSLPFGNVVGEGEAKGKTGSNIYLSKDLVPDCDMHMNLIWVFEIPVPNPYVIQHAHPYEEYLIWIGTDPDNIHDLHGEV